MLIFEGAPKFFTKIQFYVISFLMFFDAPTEPRTSVRTIPRKEKQTTHETSIVEMGGRIQKYISKFQTPNSKIKTPKSKIQNPKHTHNKTLKNQGAPCGPAHGCISLQNQVPHVSRHSVRGLQRIRTCPFVLFLEAFVVPKHEQKICTRVT